MLTCMRSNDFMSHKILKKEELHKAALCFAYLKKTLQEKACLAVLCVCIAIIIDIIAWDMCITGLEAFIFISLHALIWADYTINIYPEIRNRNEITVKNFHLSGVVDP